MLYKTTFTCDPKINEVTFRCAACRADTAVRYAPGGTAGAQAIKAIRETGAIALGEYVLCPKCSKEAKTPVGPVQLPAAAPEKV